jgi:hypothetical protein
MTESKEYLEYKAKMNAVKLGRLIRKIKETSRDFGDIFNELGSLGWTNDEEEKIISDWYKKFGTEDKEIVAVYEVLRKMEEDMKTLWKKQNHYEF